MGVSFSDVVKMGQSATAIVHETGKSVAAACVTYQLMSFVLFVVTSRFIVDCAWKSGFWFCWCATECCCDRVVHEG